MARPKSSMIGLVSAGLDLYTANKTWTMNNEIERLQRTQVANTAMTLSAIGTLAEMNFALGIQIAKCDAKLQTLTDISWKISDYFDRKELHEEFVATMRYSIHTMNRELDLIDSLTEGNLEYALWKTDCLLEVIKERDVRVEHFARVSQVEMTSAQNLLDRAAATREYLFSLLEDSDKVEEYNLLTITMREIHHESNRIQIPKGRVSLNKQQDMDKWLGILDNKTPLPSTQRRRNDNSERYYSEKKIQSLWESISHLIPYSDLLLDDGSR